MFFSSWNLQTQPVKHVRGEEPIDFEAEAIGQPIAMAPPIADGQKLLTHIFPVRKY